MTGPRLFTLPPISDDFRFGVLRRHFGKLDNDAVDFVRAKLHPVAPVPVAGMGRRWQPTAARYDVLLPPSMPQLLSSPRLLLETFEEHSRPDQRDLLIVVKIVLPADEMLHEGWERVRAYARQAFVRDHGLAVVMALHAPSSSGMHDASASHVHLMALTRRWDAGGFGAFCAIACDEGHAPLQAAWTKARDA
ncbi:MAG: MobA/MobL family protein [Janthinobacterium lividum]